MSKPIPTIVAVACLLISAVPVALADVQDMIERPLPPTALRVESSAEGNTLSWEPPLAANGAPLEAYNVYRFVDGVREALGSVDAGSTSYYDGDVDRTNSTYLYFVTAASASGESAPSNIAPQSYPWCNDVIIPIPLTVNWSCVLPLPAGPVTIILH